MEKHEFPQRMIDAVRALRARYENPGTSDCPLCQATMNEYREVRCDLCPHVVIDGAVTLDEDQSPCFDNPRVTGFYPDRGYDLKSTTDVEYMAAYSSSIHAEEIAAQRQAHIERLNRWLSVMVAEEGGGL